ncbi:hypothetical protein L0666_16870 [Octadecabacter sp. CECT 8868]|uniref:hypothetical protein n=1 Tax=Octadecabacter algicola TaxID=2909342 RepID=UPI001F367461|nr:hypothetical protein [Octadecabacter algicola]MCF2906669.1 hypothetical protein [Octadecabacter algicola]
MTKPPVAVCFFGITRSLKRTIGSIEANVLGPAEALDQGAKCYAHLFQQAHINNPRSDESGAMDLNEHSLLNLDQVEFEAPDGCLEIWDFEGLKAHGSLWNDDFRSLRNLVHQLHSLNRVTEMALAGGAEIVVFARPDLTYHDSLAPALARANRGKGDLVQLPWWQPFDGLNDRFAVVRGTTAIRAYGQRITQLTAYCAAHGPVHAEKLVRFSLEQAQVPVRTFGARASRTRIDGTSPDEIFDYPRRYEIKRRYPAVGRLVKAVKSRLK